ncbi:hypothetical protein [Streptomyces halobius]|uniref:Uncharacterized protein n=1 Tax=Streptomyces halobius TaxID=2879846 RepID=A0ABY4M9W6_9ACTN|nr:hypothetical protein [Streptomyces halobius]UQA94142.1 hypothetical protein K9S39_21710 [Streptomyces halobius]
MRHAGLPLAPAYGYALYARSHALPRTVATLLGTAILAALCAHRLNAYIDPGRRVPVVALAPMLAASAIGISLHQHSTELDRTAVRPAWPRRLAHLLALTALAAGALALAVPGHAQEFGGPAMVRNLSGAMGVTAVATAVIGARLSWLPTIAYVSALYWAGGGVPGRAATVWAWAMQPGPQPAAWATATGLFVAGGALYVVRGARPESGHG